MALDQPLSLQTSNDDTEYPWFTLLNHLVAFHWTLNITFCHYRLQTWPLISVYTPVDGTDDELGYLLARSWLLQNLGDLTTWTITLNTTFEQPYLLMELDTFTPLPGNNTLNGLDNATPLLLILACDILVCLPTPLWSHVDTGSAFRFCLRPLNWD